MTPQPLVGNAAPLVLFLRGTASSSLEEGSEEEEEERELPPPRLPLAFAPAVVVVVLRFFPEGARTGGDGEEGADELSGDEEYSL